MIKFFVANRQLGVFLYNNRNYLNKMGNPDYDHQYLSAQIMYENPQLQNSSTNIIIQNPEKELYIFLILKVQTRQILIYTELGLLQDIH